MAAEIPNHYQTLGLDYDCTTEDVKAAYRFLAKEHHPDVNAGSAEARERTQMLNAAYETLSHATRRRDYDAKLRKSASPSPGSRSSASQNLKQDLHLKIEQLIRGTNVDVQINDPGNVERIEVYDVSIPPMTPPNSKFQIPRSQNIGGGHLTVRVKALPDFRFHPRGTDLRCELNLSSELVRRGGSRSIEGPLGVALEVQIPPNIQRGEIIRIEGEGLPRGNGERGDLLMRINYRADIRMNTADSEQ